MLLALEIGAKKIGAALFEPDGRLVARSVLNRVCIESELNSLLGKHRARLATLLLSPDGAQDPVLPLLTRAIGHRIARIEVDAPDLARQALDLYYRDFPPSGLASFLPRALWPEPDVPLEGYLAEALGQHHLQGSGGAKA